MKILLPSLLLYGDWWLLEPTEAFGGSCQIASARCRQKPIQHPKSIQHPSHTLRRRPSAQSAHRLETKTFSTPSPDENDQTFSTPSPDENDQSPRHLSAAQKARREEETRRKNRELEKFATPGITSAQAGSYDFPIDIAKTEREYLASLGCSDDDSKVDALNAEKFVALWTDEGLEHLRALRFEEAAEMFNKVYEIKPEAYLWQDGLLKYYLGDYHGAAESLAKNAVRFETRFMGMEPASEERIWRDAAELKIINSLSPGRKKAKNADAPVAMRVPIAEGDDEEQLEKESHSSENR